MPCDSRVVLQLRWAYTIFTEEAADATALARFSFWVQIFDSSLSCDQSSLILKLIQRCSGMEKSYKGHESEL